MGCIYHHCSIFLSSSMESCTHKDSTGSTTGHHWLKCKPKKQVLGLGGGGQGGLPIGPTAHAFHNSSIFLSLSSPASSGDISILLPISAALFFVYWVANFVVPDIISKGFQSKGEDQTSEGVNPMEDEKQA